MLVTCLCLSSLTLRAQDWNGKKSAVVLTYDDALHIHLDQVVPALDSFQLKGTFYLTASSPAFSQRMDEWAKAAANQHELGNHTLFHPCNGSLPGRGFVQADYDLATYSLRRLSDEIRMTNTVLNAVDGQTERSFAYPCGDTQVAGLLYMDSLKQEFVGARGVHSELLQHKPTDTYNMGSYLISGQSGEELIALVKEAQRTKSLLVLLFHGVGGEHSLNVSLEAHRQLLRYLHEHANEIWNPTFRQAANHLNSLGTSK